MKPRGLTFLLYVFCFGMLSASQQTEIDQVKFQGFERLLTNTDVIAIVRFEHDSVVNFEVQELLYPRHADMGECFAPFGGAYYGKLSQNLRPKFPAVVMPGGRFVLFLKRQDTNGARAVYDSKGFVIPSYASSYGLASDLHATVPLFDLSAKELEPVKAYRKYYPDQRTEVIDERIETYARKPLRDAFGTLDPGKILSALRATLEIASGSQTYPEGPVSEALSNNIAFQNIIRDVVDGGRMKKGVLAYPELENYASKEPPAREQNFAALRKSYLKQLKIKAFKAEGVPFSQALEQLQKAINTVPDVGTTRFVISDALQRELKRFEPTVFIDAKDTEASALVELIAEGMFIEMRENRVVYIDRP